MPMQYVIIGTGPAGVIAAETLRKHDQQAKILLIGKEAEPPYSRMAIPYFLTRNIEERGTYLRKNPAHFDSKGIELLHAHVLSLEPQNNRLLLNDGNTIHYDKLLIASGSSPVKAPISGIDLPAVYSCWTLADARSIAAHMKPGAKVVLMGAGFIGCIILEALAKSGADLTVIEMGDRMVPRMMNEKAGMLIKQWCIDRGVNVLTSTKVTEISQATDGLVVHLEQGRTIDADFVVSATGVRANIDFLEGSGIDTGQGVIVNRAMQTNIPNIYASGDVAQGLDFSTGQYNVQAIQPTASEHAQIAAKNMLRFKQALHQGCINMNVLDTLGLISSSFGLWMGIEGGDSAELYDLERYRYLNLQFHDDLIVGATGVGITEHIGVLRGMIQSRLRLRGWKQKLQQDPSRIMEAYLANRLTLK